MKTSGNDDERDHERPLVDSAQGAKPFRRRAVRGVGVDILVEHFEPNDLGPHRHAQWQVVLVPPGAARDISWRTPAGRRHARRLVAGDVWILPPEWSHASRWREPSDGITLYIDDSRIRRYLPGLLRTVSSVIKLSEYVAAVPGISELCRELRQFAGVTNGPTDWRIATVGSHLATSLLHAHPMLSDGVFRPPSAMVSRIMERLKFHLSEHRGDRLRLGAISVSLGVSDRHLRRIFRDATGVSPQEWVMIQKAAFAVRCLLDAHSVKETVGRAGFTSESHLHRVIFRMYGVSPAAFRKQAQAAAGPDRA